MEKAFFDRQLTEAGLTVEQARTYQYLLESGAVPARTVAGGTELSRPLAYKVLDELVARGLVEKDDAPGKVARFSAAHPIKLRDLTEKRRLDAESAHNALELALGNMISTYNLKTGKPGIRFYEGMSGIRECMNDALTSKTEIYSYVDIAMIERDFADISRDFAKARRKLGLKKKNIGIDTPENRAEIEGYYTDVTEERLIPWPTQSFGTVMQIYDGKVSYVTSGERMIGVIISDPFIYEMHRSLFEFNWNDPRAYTPPLSQAALASDDGSGRSTIS